jgi:ABC-type uncharacterized transport system substrate-binding protein
VLDDAKKTAVFIDTALILQTPKDTTQAASSWNVSLVTADNSKVNHGSPAAAVNDAQAKINTAQKYKRILIQNMQPYIGRLNNGWSLQAPAGYVERIILQAANR